MKLSIEKLMNPKLSYILESGTAQEAATKMKEDNSSVLIVLDMNRVSPVGIVTERDLVRRLCAEDVPCNEIFVKHIMSTPIVTIDPYSPVETAADIMKQNRVRHLLVVDNANPKEAVGMLSTRDFAPYIEHEYLEEAQS